MSVAIRAPSHPIAGHSMTPNPRIQSRPSTSSASSQQRPMAPRPAPKVQARPSQPPTPSASSSSRTTPAPAPRPIPQSRASSSSSATSPSALPAASGASKDTSSSAGKIFAKPSKEWVLPERAKPGRKVSVEEPDNKRQSQNRLSQRAHRARRTDYIQTLEERLRQYEANEIHSNVRLQEVARALKADNERLRNDVASLNASCAEINAEKSSWEMEKIAMQEAMRVMKVEMDALRAGRNVQTIVRMEVDQESIDRLVPGPSLQRKTSTSNSLPIIATQKRALADCPICPNPDPDCPCQQPQPQQAYTPIRDQNPTLAPNETSSCGLCQSTDECLCRVIHDELEEEDVKPYIVSPDKGFKPDEGCGLCTSSSFCACRAASDSPSTSSFNRSLSQTTTSVAPAAALPLRLRAGRGGSGTKASIWALNTTASTSMNASRPKEAVCTGDPDNCDACRNDSFGREFCQHLFEADHDGSGVVKASGSCGDCSGNCMSIKSLLSPAPSPSPSQSQFAPVPSSSRLRTVLDIGIEDEAPAPLGELQMACCGDPGLCGGHHGTGCTGEVVALGRVDEVHEHDHDHDHEEEEHEILRPDQAWKQLKAHPNAKFASLALLADVVARRTVCLNEQSEAEAEAKAKAQSAAAAQAYLPPPAPSSTAQRSQAHTHLGQKRRTLGLETSGLRDALRFLDRATPTPTPAPSGGAPSPSIVDHDEEEEERMIKRRKM